MHAAILGTAGHIDHGKTALVAALTGVDTDRLKEEKERGITIDLGFAELRGEGLRLGVVDVPGHEGFVRNMLAGATGMDLALLVVAGDEGVMPQTREHLAILSLLGVNRLVVAVTKIDLVEADWIELVEEEIRERLEAAGWGEVPILRVSSRSGEGVEALRERLLAEGEAVRKGRDDDLLALPIDRVFTVRGTGTVVTGTLLSGRVAVGDKVRLLPSDRTARVRGVQVHGEDLESAGPGTRTAVALTGDGIERQDVERGQMLVAHPEWAATHRITVSFRVLPDTGWTLKHNQRVRVHLGTAEVMARCVLFETDELGGGDEGWGQLRLEEAIVTRGGLRGVVRSYSPVTTIAGIRVVEPDAPRRGRGSDAAGLRLPESAAGVEDAVTAAVDRAGAAGVQVRALSVATGAAPALVQSVVDRLIEAGAVVTASGRIVAPALAQQLGAHLRDAVETVHRDEPWRPGVAVETLRARLPHDAADGLADRLLAVLTEGGELDIEAGLVRRTGYEVTLDEARLRLRDRLVAEVEAGGLAAPFVEELSADLREDPAFGAILDGLVRSGDLVALDHTLHLSRAAADGAIAEVRSRLQGRDGLGPADFREALPVTRRHLLPILTWMDRCGVTTRDQGGRTVHAAGGAGEPQGNPP